jgi:hypothetical protein
MSGLSYDEVAEERATPEGLRPDVLLLERGDPVLGIEILVTHEVDDGKASRTAHPWVELDALRLIAAPRIWRPHGWDHPWRGLCRDCHWGEQVAAVAFSEDNDPGEAAAEFAAALFHARLGSWLARQGRARPTLHWQCPACMAKNRRPLVRERLVDIARTTALGPPILPEVRLGTATGGAVAIQFAAPGVSRLRPAAILPDASLPVVRIRPDCRRPLRLHVTGTNRPRAFLCPRCGGDCCGTLPPCWSPLPGWAAVLTGP